MEASPDVVSHKIWDTLLKTHVSPSGAVNYSGFIKDSIQLNQYLKLLGDNPPQENWSTAAILAYYINAYNAHTVKLIIENYPVKSIKDIPGAWTKARVPMGKNTLSLGGIENSLLRKMNEPRIHFAINCASISCPKLLNEAYTATQINAQLDKVAYSFINGKENTITPSHIKLSSIFKWYKKDYIVNNKANLIAYLNQYSTITILPSATISYKDYNWNLNKLY